MVKKRLPKMENQREFLKMFVITIIGIGKRKPYQQDPSMFCLVAADGPEIAKSLMEAKLETMGVPDDSVFIRSVIELNLDSPGVLFLSSEG